MNKHAVIVHDPTLRDGQHAVRHQLDRDQIRAYAAAADAAGVPVVEVGHGNGLGASSHQVGHAKLSDDEMLATAREAMPHSRMATFILPGWGVPPICAAPYAMVWTWCASARTAPRPTSPSGTSASSGNWASKPRGCC